MTAKKVALVIFSLLLVTVVAALLYVNYLGLIPRHDYDTEKPVIPDFEGPSVLIFSKTNGYIHREAIPAANTVLTKLAQDNNFQVYSTENAAIHNPEQLQTFDLVIWNNVSGDVLTETQREHFKTWIEQGGRWLGIHASGGDMQYDWSWYVDELIGAQFIGHTMHPQFEDATLNKADSKLDITQFLPSPWIVPQEEWYAFDRNPIDTGYEILIKVDESSYNTDPTPWLGFVATMEGMHPLVWRKNMKHGKMFYSAIGHQAHTYDLPEYQQLLSNAITWLTVK